MPVPKEIRSPTIPSRSPFRIRDSQLAKQRANSHVDRWSFTMELGNMWNMMPTDNIYHHDNKSLARSTFSSSHLLTQLLISQAILDSNEYQILTFDQLEKLKKELSQIQDHSSNLARSITLENRIKLISKSLENVNLKNSRDSVIFLQHQRQNNEQKIKLMTKKLENLKAREGKIKRTLLQHTSGVLNKGIHYIEASRHTPQDDSIHLQQELDQVKNRISHLCKYKLNIIKPNTTSLDTLPLLLKLEEELIDNREEKAIISRNRMQLVSLNHQKQNLLSRLLEMELMANKLLSYISVFPQRQIALKIELIQYKSEAIEVRIWDKKRQRNEDADRLMQDMSSKDDPEYQSNKETHTKFQQQLEGQAKLYEADLHTYHVKQQQKTDIRERLESSCEALASEKSHLDTLMKEKTRKIDEQDIHLSRLNDELRNISFANSSNSTANTNGSNNNKYYEQERTRLKQDFAKRESQWTAHTTQAEDSFDQLLDNFDELTNTAIEFDSRRMRYDRRIEELHQHINQLEMQLIDEKVGKIGYGAKDQEAPTTVSLRKEFRLLVADIKRKHQQRMDQEADEIRRLQVQLEEMQDTNNKPFKYQHSMATQT